jgi:sulfur carrier protein
MRFFVFMRLILNGEKFETVKAETVRELLDELKIMPGRVAVEVNLEIVRKADYETYKLSESDKVEIVNFVGGG